MRELKNRI